MNLTLYSSTSIQQEPNLVGLQHPLLAVLPTQLACPVREETSLTPLCEAVLWNGKKYIVACDLILSINRKGLHSVVFLDEETSARILKTFQRRLATVAPERRCPRRLWCLRANLVTGIKFTLRRISQPANRGLVDLLHACPSVFEIQPRETDDAQPLEL